MFLTKINASNFRNYSSLDISFQKGINVLYGLNGSGKTNIVEAIDYLKIGKSFKTNSYTELIKFNEDFSKINIYLQKEKLHELNAIISNEGRKIFHNGIELTKLSELTGILIDVVFTPEDVLLFKDSPLNRRKLLDITLSSLDKKYLQNLKDYSRILKERNELLKNEDIDDTYLEVITEKMIDYEFYIYLKRDELIKKLNSLINEVYKQVDDQNSQVELSYKSFVNESNFETYKNKAMKIYRDTKQIDIKRKLTNEGITRDDFKTFLDGREISLYGSQGQNRLTCLALKLSIYEIIKKEIGENPILILDDVLSELDENHQNKLIAYLENVEQTFITCTEVNEKLNKYSTYQIVDDAVIRR